MFDSLMLAALIVIVIWIAIIAIFLRVSRQQPAMQDQMESVEELLEKAERKNGR